MRTSEIVNFLLSKEKSLLALGYFITSPFKEEINWDISASRWCLQVGLLPLSRFTTQYFHVHSYQHTFMDPSLCWYVVGHFILTYLLNVVLKEISDSVIITSLMHLRLPSYIQVQWQWIKSWKWLRKVPVLYYICSAAKIIPLIVVLKFLCNHLHLVCWLYLSYILSVCLHPFFGKGWCEF